MQYAHPGMYLDMVLKTRNPEQYGLAAGPGNFDRKMLGCGPRQAFAYSSSYLFPSQERDERFLCQ